VFDGPERATCEPVELSVRKVSDEFKAAADRAMWERVEGRVDR